jgi:DNA-binding NarL/FixJ family response regulator
VIPHGVFALTLHSTPEVDQEFATFLRTIGTLIMLHQLRQKVRVQSFELKSKQKRESKHGALTTRQLLIRRLIEKGHTNAEIADQIGYSESLVRHETMEIYAVLNVSGRKELLDNSGNA